MITNIEDLRAQGGAQEVTLPGFEGPDSAFVCLLRRPTLYALAATGLIPNPLLPVARAIFSPQKEELEKIPLDQEAKLLQALARYALVEPSYAQLEEAGIALTDEQLTCIYILALSGVRALEPFRRAMRSGAGQSGAIVPSDAQQSDGDD